MRNPTRRNRNIGTSKQGYGRDNKFAIPFPCKEMKNFYERLGKYRVVERIINEHQFKFIVEETRTNSFHACTIDDLEKVLWEIPKNDYGDLKLIVLRQPTRKEEMLKPVWGRLIYSYEFENDLFPAVIIEATDLDRNFKWTKKLNNASQKELERLIKDGHKIVAGKRHYHATYEIENIRSTQLYRTLLHEFGHYVHYLETVTRPLSNAKNQLDLLDAQINDDDTSETNPLFDKWSLLYDEYNKKIEKLEKRYFTIPSDEKEIFAHSYAEKLRKILEDKHIIPFDRILDEQKIKNAKLKISDFKKITVHNTM